MKHLDRKYFRYRTDIVARWQADYPERAGVIATSEVMRLGFLLFGAVLVALLSGVLAVTATGRVGYTDWRPYVFAAVALFSTYIAVRVIWSLAVERRQA
jgi:hypothetical protein